MKTFWDAFCSMGDKGVKAVNQLACVVMKRGGLEAERARKRSQAKMVLSFPWSTHIDGSGLDVRKNMKVCRIPSDLTKSD